MTRPDADLSRLREVAAGATAHDVKFHIGTGTVVCTCGAYFEAERYGTMPRNAVSLWAEHVHEGLRNALDHTDPSGEGK